jgi:DNA-directed RNA polymerase specialized sigma24 family protein
MCASSLDAGGDRSGAASVEASLRELGLLHPDEPEEVRRAAFESLLRRRGGWWGTGTITDFALASSRGEAARVLRARGAPDTIDWEAIALQSLLTLFQEGYRVTRSPRAWLRAVIRHQICHAVRRESFHLAHARIDQLSGVELSTTALAEGPRSGRASLEGTAVEGALAHLPPALQSVAKLYVCDRLGRREVRSVLGISDVVLRGRLLRLRSRLTQMLSNAAPPALGHP